MSEAAEAVLVEEREAAGPLDPPAVVPEPVIHDAETLARMAAAERGRGRYRSCDWIEGYVFVHQAEVKLCCMESIGNTVGRLFELEPGRSLQLDEVLAAKKQVRLANQGAAAPCNGCFLLKEAEWEALNYLSSIAIAGFLHCNLSCSYCITYDFNPHDRGGGVIDMMEGLLAQGGLRPGLSRIEWGGGESTFHRDFDSVAELASLNGVSMTVYTNATVYMKTVEDGLRRRTAKVVCSIDAGTEETYTRIKGKPFLRRVWNNLTRYMEASRCDVIPKYIVMEANSAKSELDAFLHEAKQAGALNIAVSIDTHNNTASDGEVTDAVASAAAYLLAEAERLGIGTIVAEVLSPPTQKRIADRAAALSQGPLPTSLLTNAPRPLEIAFTEGRILLRRVAVALEQRDTFNVIFPQPPSADEPLGNLRVILRRWLRLQGDSPVPADTPPPVAAFLAQALAAEGQETLDAEWAEPLAPLGDYALRLVLKGERLIRLEFTLDETASRRAAPADL